MFQRSAQRFLIIDCTSNMGSHFVARNHRSEGEEGCPEHAFLTGE